ncbi:MAG: diguanylate cyclase [Gammaproteobacteria bacterium]|nr:diguanylate cyclase [Gammaproteobacteria bacterium]MBU1647305.1 diguanylate cyclase [Gammaproteobacteria bacterium]MBU1971052.1 diguanylate cyclase [Gammaproteobacteria bacterium]
MKLGIAQRLGLLLALIGVLASGLTGYYAYNASRDLLVKAAEERLLTATRVLVRQITVALDNTGRHVRLVAGHPRVAQALASTDPKVRAEAGGDLAALFSLILKTNPEYFQMRLIAAAENGMERVRVDRDEKGLVRVDGDDLQEKGHYPYVFNTLKLPADTIYISRPVINHEGGAHAGQGRPSLQMASPVYGGGKEALGMVVINLDMNGTFKLLAADLPSDIGLYLTNRRGEFLVHPDSEQAFAFDKGRQVLVQQQFPATAELLDGRNDNVVTTAQLESPQGGAVVAAFIKQPLKAPQQDAFFILGLTQPLNDVLQESDDLGFATLRIVLAFSALSVLLGALLARAVTGPLNQMVHAVQRFAAGGKTREPLPLSRGDEIGVLARSFDDMQQQIETQMASVQEKQSELDHLASHDSLTGLPNRRMFLDRLDHALARARRSGEHMVLLFIDLDHFKEINDRLGHAAGDVVLRAAAERMHGVVREIDTVARLGGDEFIILLDGAHDAEAIAHVASKVLECLAAPVSYKEEELRIGASIGIGQYPQDGGNATELIAAADRAMYQAKGAGRNRYCFAASAPADPAS